MSLLKKEITEPLDVSLVRTGKDSKGNEFYYYNYIDIAKHLNKHLGLAWSYRVTPVVNDASEPLVHASLTITDEHGQECTREQYGSSLFSSATDSYAEKLKASASVGLTKCASLFGIGIELYDKAYLKGIKSMLQEKEDKIAALKSSIKNAAKEKKLSNAELKTITCEVLGIDQENYSSDLLSLEDYQKIKEFFDNN